MAQPDSYIAPPYIGKNSNWDDPRVKAIIADHLRRLSNVAQNLSFLDADGGVASGRKPFNIDAVWVQYVSNGTANTEDTVAHNLGRIPSGIWVGIPNKNAVVYADNQAAWTSTNIRLKASAVTVTVNILVF